MKVITDITIAASVRWALDKLESADVQLTLKKNGLLNAQSYILNVENGVVLEEADDAGLMY